MDDHTMPVPPWLERLLNTAFFDTCRAHGAAARSECNMYCLDCGTGNAFCFYCRSSKHKDHQVIQIRRSSYHDVVRVSEIQKVLNISGVQTYVINSSRVLFLNERPLHQPKGGSTKATLSRVCQVCGRSLLDTFCFCSLGCKLVGIQRNIGNASFSLDAKNGVVVQIGEGISRKKVMSKTSPKVDTEEEVVEGLQDIYPPTTPSPPSARRRKGIPQRAPFRS